MSRHLKRVPLDFDWPLKEVWGGYLNPYYKQAGTCPDCENGYDRAKGRLDANAALFHDQWYGNVLFDPIAYGAEPLSQLADEVWSFARRNIKSAPDYYMTDAERAAILKFKQDAMLGFPAHEEPLIAFPTFDQDAAIAREAKRLYNLWKNQWCHHLIQADVDALIEADRLWDFTRVPVNDEQREVVRAQLEAGENSWLPYPNGQHPTAAKVNAWSFSSFGHDGLNRGVCIEARCKREGVPYMCVRCAGSGRVWPTPEIQRRYESWEREGPPTGDGYQLWEDCSEGSPVSPVFTSLDDLCTWAADHATTFAHFTATKAQWLEMLTDSVVHHAEGNLVFM